MYILSDDTQSIYFILNGKNIFQKY